MIDPESSTPESKASETELTPVSIEREGDAAIVITWSDAARHAMDRCWAPQGMSLRDMSGEKAKPSVRNLRSGQTIITTSP